MINNAKAKRVYITEHEGCTLYWDQLGFLLEHLETLLPECSPGSQFNVSIADATEEWLDSLPDFEGY